MNCDVNYVNGPAVISYHTSNKYDKRIYIFGEYHKTTGNDICKNSPESLDVPDIFDKILHCNYNVYPNRVIDLFVEDMHMINDDVIARDGTASLYPGISSEARRIIDEWSDFRNDPNVHEEYQDYLGLFRTHFMFLDCERKKQYCKDRWPNLRYHAIDRRHSIDNDVSMIMIYAEIRTALDYLKQIVAQDAPDANQINNTYIFLSELLFNINNFAKITKQINANSPEIKSKLNIFFATRIRRFKQMFSKATMSDDTMYTVLQIESIVSEVFVLYTDIYALARMFRTFDNHVSKYIIVHAGAEHAQNYRDFLDSLGFSSNVLIGNNCVDVSSIDNFMFFPDITSLSYRINRLVSGHSSRRSRKRQ